jgi:hypothetical protein
MIGNMLGTLKLFSLTLFACALQAAQPPGTTAMTVSASGTVASTGATLTGTATFTNGIPGGTFYMSICPIPTAAGFSTSFTIVAPSGAQLFGDVTLPTAILSGGTGIITAATNVGTGSYAGDVYQFNLLAGSASLAGGTLTLNFSGTGTLFFPGASPSPGAQLIGVFRPPMPVGGALGFFTVDSNGSFSFDGAGVDKTYQFGLAGDIPVVGDWGNDGTATLGVFRCPAPGAGLCTWYIDQNHNGVWDAGVFTGDGSFQFGLPGDIPVVGDWTGTGGAKAGVMRCPAIGQPGVCTWYLDAQNLRQPYGNFLTRAYGLPGDLPAVGRWTGIGSATDSIGVFRNGTWILNSTGTGSWNPADAQYSYGLPGDVPVIGEWSGLAKDKLGVFRCSNGGTCQWVLNMSGCGAFSTADLVTYFGLPGDKPVVGRWSFPFTPQQ